VALIELISGVFGKGGFQRMSVQL